MSLSNDNEQLIEDLLKLVLAANGKPVPYLLRLSKALDGGLTQDYADVNALLSTLETRLQSVGAMASNNLQETESRRANAAHDTAYPYPPFVFTPSQGSATERLQAILGALDTLARSVTVAPPPAPKVAES